MTDNEEDHSQVKQAVDEEYSEDTAEQPSIKISVPQGLEAEIEVREEEDLETVLANLEFLARRQGFDIEGLSRSGEPEEGSQEEIEEILDEIEELSGTVDGIKDHVGDLDSRLSSVENEFGGEDSQMAVLMDELQQLDDRVDRVEDDLGGDDGQLDDIMDRLQQLDDKVEDMPDDVSRRLGELREQIKALEDYVDDVEQYATSLDEDMEALRQQPTEEQDGVSAEETEEQVDQGVDSEEVEDEAVEVDPEHVEETEDGFRMKEESSEEQSEDRGEQVEALYDSLDDFQELSTDERAEEIKQIIKEHQRIGVAEIGEHLFGKEPSGNSSEYKEIHNRISWTIDDVEKGKEGRKSVYSLPDEEGDDSSQPDEEDDVDDESDEAESEGLFRSVSAFNNLSREQRVDEVKQVIRENEPIGTAGICNELFGDEAKSGTDAYAAVQNIMQDFRDELDVEKDGRSAEYSLPETDEQDPSESDKAETEAVTDVEESERPETQAPPEPEPEEPQPEPVETSSSGGDDDKDFSDHDGRYSLEELREDEDLSVEAEVLKVFQEYRKDYGPISIPEATQILFGSEASEEDEQYQVVWNQLETHSRKDGDRVERIEKEEEEDRFEVYGPFKYCNLFYDSHHTIICTKCPPGENAIYSRGRDAVDHKVNTRRDGSKEHHNAFISAQIPQNSWYRGTNLIEKIVDRECGDE